MVGLMTVGCTTSSPPDELGLLDPSTSTLPPVTTAAIVTTTVPATTWLTSTQPAPESTVEEIAPSNLDIIGESMQAVLGPTDDLTAVFGSLAAAPPGLPTPPDADVFEMSIGAGQPDAKGEVVAQISLSVTTSAESSAVFAQISNGLAASGLVVLDAFERGSIQSAAFGAPGDELFDEFVVTASPVADGSVVRLSSNGSVDAEKLSTYLNWSEEPLPLPAGDDARTLVVMSRSGIGRLSLTTLSVQSTAIVSRSSPQAQANRLVRTAVDSGRFEFEGDPTIDQPLTGSFLTDEFDSLTYEVVASTRIEIDRNDEPRDEEVVEVTLRGIRRD